MSMLVRIAVPAVLLAFTTLRAWLAVLGLAEFVGTDWAIALVVVMALCRLMLPLQIAVLVGALAAWHWPLLLALIVAAPRLVLVLPGLISTFLAARRHPQPRWSSPPSAAAMSRQA
jgi:hypothetical protein